MTDVHIENKNRQLSLCGRVRYKCNITFLCRQYNSKELVWIFQLKPTCEACILLHFSNPENTYISNTKLVSHKGT